MNAPDTIYLQYVADDDDLWSDTTWCDVQINEDDIVYDRRKTCVWRPHRNTGSMRPDTHAAIIPAHRVIKWTYCPYCGGRIELEE